MLVINNHKILSNFEKGEKGIIKKFITNDVPIKLFEIGFLPGVEFKLLFTALFFGPIFIIYGQLGTKSYLILRKKEAKNILAQYFL